CGSPSGRVEPNQTIGSVRRRSGAWGFGRRSARSSVASGRCRGRTVVSPPPPESASAGYGAGSCHPPEPGGGKSSARPPRATPRPFPGRD
ncbi:MAG: hypothetical protein AVDCRST_MAG59-4984, partial [uncultured Thermomicrobiales bacterium]